ncbi:MAG TPA: hypothetical protein VEK08_11000 [Planctomycetota bacterium]|nr:hypothetical protein [Planctomycetota bacterium]
MRYLPLLCLCLCFAVLAEEPSVTDGLSITWEKDLLFIKGSKIPGGPIKIRYLEAYCRPGSTDRDWSETTIGHKTELIEASSDGKKIKLRCNVKDGVIVDHEITAGKDEVAFKLTAHNPTQEASNVHWVQPCIHVQGFTGGDKLSYIRKCFIFLDGKLARLPTQPWAEKARYIPGQVYCPKHVDRNDVNPRPLSSLVPSNGLMGVYSADEKMVIATAWEPYQELFQGVYTCIHSDFRIGGLKPGETKKIRGKIYVVPAEIDQLVKRYENDFPEHK